MFWVPPCIVSIPVGFVRSAQQWTTITAPLAFDAKPPRKPRKKKAKK